MSQEIVLFIIAGAFCGGFINWLAGFGTGLFALGWWLSAMPVLDAVVVVVIMSLVGGMQGLFAVRNAIDPGNLLRFLVPALGGIAIGYWLLDYVNITLLKLLLATLLILFGGFFTFRKTLPSLKHRYRFIDALIGFVGGILGAIAGLSGALLTMWTSLYDWPKAARRAIIQPFNMIVLTVVLGLMAWRGMLGPHIWLWVAVAFPFSILGTQVGIFVFRRLTDQQFQKLLVWLTLISGLVLAGRELAAIILAV